MNQPTRQWPLWLAAFITVFIANAAIMTVELVAGRLVSPHIGMSLYTWTSIIGIVMAGMSVGHYLGGWLADRLRARRTLGVLFLLGAGGVASVLLTNDWVGGLTALRGMSWPLRIFVHTGLLFFLPALLLGAIAPVVAKMALYAGQDAGRVMGGVFASGVAGSIAGTFLTGFYLVVTFPVPLIVGVSAAVLAAVGLLYLLSSFVLPEPAPERVVPSQHVERVVRRWRFNEWFPPNATVFASNFAFMAIEIAALRMVAREFGASLYSWTSVIGIVLAGITLGNALGGRLAARTSTALTVTTLFLAAAATSVLTLPLSNAAAGLLDASYALMTSPWSFQIVVYTTLAFFVPNIFIGMISPVIVKRALTQGHGAGVTVGNIYAAGAIGSITATFLSGYLLIDWIGPRPLIALSALGLVLTGLAYRPRHAPALAGVALAVLVLVIVYVDTGITRQLGQWTALRGPAEPNLVYEDESQYSYIAVQEDPQNPQLRMLLLDTLKHSAVNLENPLDLRYEYEQIYESVLDFLFPQKQAIRAFVIGGGGYSFPHYLEAARPDSYIEVAEIDPAVTEAAFAALGLPRDTDLHIFNQDARNRVEDLVRMQAVQPDFEGFDAIFGDSINDYTVPYHLTTLEFTQDIHALLKPDGVYMLNCIDIFKSGRFVGAMLNTMEAVFETVYLFSTYRTPTQRDTFVLVGCKAGCDLEPLRPHTTMLPRSDVAGLRERSAGVVLTDDYAPVENMLAPVVRAQGGKIGEIYFEAAKRAAEAGDYVRALQEAEKAVGVHPMWPEAWQFVAEQRDRLGDTEGVFEALREAQKGHTDPGKAHHDLAQAFFIAKRYEDAAEEWTKAIQIAPGNVNHRYNLGLALTAQQNMDAALEVWESVLQIAPQHMNTLHNLALGYLMSGRPDEAWAMVGRIREAGGTPDPAMLERLQAVSPRDPAG